MLFSSQWAYGGKSNGGVLLTPELAAGETLTFRLSGRSSKARIDHFVFFPCDAADDSCQNDSTEYDAAVAAAASCVGLSSPQPPTPTPAADAEPTPTVAPTAAPTPTATSSPAPVKSSDPVVDEPAPSVGRCAVYAGANGVVRIPAASAGAGDGWVESTVAGREALVFKPEKQSTGIDGAGRVGVKEYKFKVDEAGAYRVMMRLNAPHPTDHNEYVGEEFPSGREGRCEHPPLRGAGVEGGSGGGWARLKPRRPAWPPWKVCDLLCTNTQSSPL